MDDDDFLATFERAGFGAHEFRHREHLRMACLYVQRYGAEAAVAKACDGIRHLAAAHGHTTLYHDTLTRAWVRVVALAMARSGARSFDELISTHPALLDRDLLLHHWSRDLLFSPGARSTWTEPDLAPLPAL
jgi:hypothetical protein